MVDNFIERTRRVLDWKSAEQRDIRSLRNWLDGTGCIAREEEAYLGHTNDLCSLAPVNDHALRQIEHWVEEKLIRFYHGFRNVK